MMTRDWLVALSRRRNEQRASRVVAADYCPTSEMHNVLVVFAAIIMQLEMSDLS